MPISEAEWDSIRAMCEDVSARVSGNKSFFTSGKVLKTDKTKSLVWIEEFGDQPIPVVGFRYEIKYYDETPNGTTAVAAGNSQPYKTRTKTITVTPMIPKAGDIVLIVSEMGTRRLPRCVGVILGKDWLVAEED